MNDPNNELKSSSVLQYVQQLSKKADGQLTKLGHCAISCEVPFPLGWQLPPEAEPHYANLVNRQGSDKDSYLAFTNVMKHKNGARALHFIALPESAAVENISQVPNYLASLGLEIPSLKEAMWGYHHCIKGEKHPSILTMNEAIETAPYSEPRNGYIMLPPSYKFDADVKNFILTFPKNPIDCKNTVIMGVKL